MSDQCPTCREWIWTHTFKHVCDPQWLVWRPEHSEKEEDADTVFARDAEAAAEKRAEEDDQYGDYDIVRGTEAIFMVRPADLSAEAVKYSVSGESVPEYTAREAK